MSLLLCLEPPPPFYTSAHHTTTQTRAIEGRKTCLTTMHRSIPHPASQEPRPCRVSPNLCSTSASKHPRLTPSRAVTRVKKIIHADEDISNCSNNAAFAIAIATEMFIRHMTEAAHTIVKSERRPRRNIQYKDVGESSFCPWLLPLPLPGRKCPSLLKRAS